MSEPTADTSGRASRAGLVPHPEDLGAAKLIGLGGTGGIVARYLMMYLAALDVPARVVLIDGDEFEPQNAERMFFSRPASRAAAGGLPIVRERIAAMNFGSRRARS